MSGGGAKQFNTRGCTLLRYPEGAGTFIEYKSPANTDAVMEVIDAQYRPTETYKWEKSATDTSIPNITGSSYYIYNGKEYSYISAMASEVTMSYLLNNYKSRWTSDGTATSNNQYINTSSYPAGYYCYSISIDSSNGKWLLPTIWQLQVIWMLSDDIDDIENPDVRYKASRLGYTNSRGRLKYSYFWSCSEVSSGYPWSVSYRGYVYYGTNNHKQNSLDVLPVREH